ncbi:hypothetical protein [Peribacillus muralis]|uniref:hypothetical protein n=1 Tax=Peribacillus muralis TaxID=264697 RepID=UPI00366EE2C2
MSLSKLGKTEEEDLFEEVSTSKKRDKKKETNVSTEANTDVSTNTGIDETDLAALFKAKIGPPPKPEKKQQISAYLEPKVHKAFTKYKGNGEKGQKSELVNNLLKIYFGIED